MRNAWLVSRKERKKEKKNPKQATTCTKDAIKSESCRHKSQKVSHGQKSLTLLTSDAACLSPCKTSGAKVHLGLRASSRSASQPTRDSVEGLFGRSSPA